MAAREHSEGRASGRVGAAVRARIIEAAGEEFAAKGFDRATSRQICLSAGVNTAAVNYHFGGFDALYAQVVAEAHRRATSPDTLVAAALADASAAERLLAVVDAMIHRLTKPPARSWEIRVLSRELVAPALADGIIEGIVEPHRTVMKAMIAEALGCSPADHRVGHVLLFVIAPCLMMATANGSAAKAMFPGLHDDEGGNVEPLASLYTRFVSAGLRACAEPQAHPAPRSRS